MKKLVFVLFLLFALCSITRAEKLAVVGSGWTTTTNPVTARAALGIQDSGADTATINALIISNNTVQQVYIDSKGRTSVVTLTNYGNTFKGSFVGNGSSLSNLNASQVISGTLPQSVLPASVVTNGAAATLVSLVITNGGVSGTNESLGTGWSIDNEGNANLRAARFRDLVQTELLLDALGGIDVGAAGQVTIRGDSTDGGVALFFEQTGTTNTVTIDGQTGNVTAQSFTGTFPASGVTGSGTLPPGVLPATVVTQAVGAPISANTITITNYAIAQTNQPTGFLQTNIVGSTVVFVVGTNDALRAAQLAAAGVVTTNEDSALNFTNSQNAFTGIGNFSGGNVATIRGQQYSLPASLTYPTNFMANVYLPFTNGSWGVHVLHTNGTTTTYLTTTNTAAERGVLFGLAESVADDGDVFFLSVGAFDLSIDAATLCGQSFDFNEGISVVGAGIDRTMLNLTSGALLGGRSSFRNLTITNAVGSSVDRIVSYLPASTNNPSWFINVKSVIQDIDFLILASSLNNSWVFKNSMFYGPYDCFASSGTHASSVIYCFNNLYFLTGGAGVYQTSVKYTDMARTAYIYNDAIFVNGGTNGNYGSFLRYNGTAYFYNSSVTVGASATTNLQFFAASGSTNIIANDCTLDTAKIGGKYSIITATPDTVLPLTSASPLPASQLTGTVPDAQLGSAALTNRANIFMANQTINGVLALTNVGTAQGINVSSNASITITYGGVTRYLTFNRDGQSRLQWGSSLGARDGTIDISNGGIFLATYLSADYLYSPLVGSLRIDLRGQGTAYVATNFLETIAWTSRSSAYPFAAIRATNKIFEWYSNSVPPTKFGSYYDASTNLQTKWTQ